MPALRFLPLVFLGLSVVARTAEAQDDERPLLEQPAKYVLDYPQAARCCPPIRSTFYEVTRSENVVSGKRFRQKPNGGYGLPVIDKVGEKNLLHVGADLGWYQIGEPVHAVADGVVRVSDGPEFKANAAKADLRPGDLAWGNFVVLEHRFGEDDFYTTLYGHLATERLVKVGDVVRVGQPLGTIGRQHARINGGYPPHVHFGVRRGRMAEIGAELLRLQADGRSLAITLAALGEEEIEVEMPAGAPSVVQLTLNGRPYLIEIRDGKSVAPAALLWELRRPDFALTGYALTTEGWLDPVQFLRDHQAHTFQ